MTEFKDANGKTWQLKLTIDAIDRVNAIINQGRGDAPPLDLLELTDKDGLFDPDLFRAITMKPRQFAAVLAEAVQWSRDDEAEGRELADGLRGDTINAALAAFMRELSFFFPESQRPILLQLLEDCLLITRKGGELFAKATGENTRRQLEENASLAPIGS